MPLLSTRQTESVRELISDLHHYFLIRLLGDQAVSSEVRKMLRKKGYSWPLKPTEAPTSAFKFGLLVARLQAEGKEVPTTYREFQKFLRSNPIPLTPQERAMVNHIDRQVTHFVKGLGDTISSKTGEILMAADAKIANELEGKVKSKLMFGVKKRQVISQVASEMRAATQDYATDFLRVAATELNNAYQQGKRVNIQSRNKGHDPFVYKLPRPNCCPECADTYLEPGTRKPRVFRLSRLVANGSNVGRNKASRRPVVGSHHPFCACELLELPAGFDLDELGSMHYVGGMLHLV